MTDFELETSSPSRRAGRDALWVVLILGLTFLVYAKTLSNDFTYDDRFYAAAYTMRGVNPMVEGSPGLAAYFSRPMGYGLQGKSRGFRPVTVLSYASTHKLFRAKIPQRRHPDFAIEVQQNWTDPAWPQHLLNLLLHLLASWLAYLLVRRLCGPGWPARVAMAVFALHALHADPVCSIVGRGELLPFVGGATAALLYERAARSAAQLDWSRLLASMLGLMVAFLSKESAIAWAVMVPLFAFVVRVADGQAPAAAARGQLWPGALVVGLPAVVFFGLYLRMLVLAPDAQGFAVALDSNPLFQLGLIERLPTAVLVWAHGLRLVLWPYPLSSDYSAKVFEVVGYADAGFWLAGGVLLAVLAAGLIRWRRQPLLLLAVAFFFGFSFVTSNLPVAVETIFGERLYYTPALAASFLAAFLVQRFGRPLRYGVLVWTVVVAGIALGRSFDWADNATLFAVDAETYPQCTSLQMNMARIARLSIPPDHQRRTRYLQRILDVDPESFAARNDMAVDLITQGRHAEARPHLTAALASIQKLEFEMRAHGADLLVNLGGIERKLGAAAAAQARYQSALKLGGGALPSMAAHSAMLGLIWVAWDRQDVEAVARHLATATSMFPGSKDLAVHRGLLAWRAGDHHKAAEVIGKGLREIAQDEDYLLAWRALQESLQAIGKQQEALEVQAMRARWALRLGQSELAATLVKDGLTRSGKVLDFHRIGLWLAWQSGEAAAVKALVQSRLTRALALAPKDGELWIHNGIGMHLEGDHQQAVRILLRTVPKFQAHSEYLPGWIALCEALLEVGDIESAGEVLRDVCQRNRSMPAEYSARFLGLHKRIQSSSSKWK